MLNDAAEALRFFVALENDMLLRVRAGDSDNSLYLGIHAAIVRVATEFSNLTTNEIVLLVEDTMEDFWDFMIVDKSGVGGVRDIDSARRKYPMGYWNASSNQVYLGVGLDGISETQLLEGYGTTTHLYDNIPDPIHWNLQHFDQGSVRCFMGAVEIREIDAISSVPSMPHLESQELALWVEKASKGRNEWQRPLDTRRVHSIQKFTDISSENHILTPILLYCEPGTKSVSIDWDSGKVVIDPSLFLNKTGAGYSDRKVNQHGDNDLRPLWIVDGQHRTRGMATSKQGSQMKVPIILLAGGDHPFAMDREAAAKLFTEINTYSEEIGFELKHFLSYRFKLPGTGTLNYEDLSKGAPHNKDRRRANIYAYRLAAYLSQPRQKVGPGSLERGFAISPADGPGKKVKQTRIILKKGLDEVRKWFLNDDLYGPASQMTEYTKARDEVSNFFRALDKVVGANWQPKRGRPKSTLEKPNVVRYILKAYPNLRESARGTRRKSSVLSQDVWEKALGPLSKVDWMHTAGTSTGEWASKWFADWVVRAVKDGGDYTKREVRSSDPKLGVLPGRGIRAPPGPANAEVVGAWPAVAGGRMTISVTPPSNAFRTMSLEKLSVRVNNNVVTSDSKFSKADDKYNVTISGFIDVPLQLDVDCVFKNPNLKESPFSKMLRRP